MSTSAAGAASPVPSAAAAPTAPTPEPSAADPLVRIRDLRVHYAIRGGFFSRLAGRSEGAVKALDGITIDLRRGEVLGLVGESGSGKTTLGRAVLHLAPVTSGEISFDGESVSGLSESAFRPYRRRMQVIFQDPHAALNPAMDIGTAVGHPLRIHSPELRPAEVDRRVRETLEQVGLAPVDQFIAKYPSDLSGGQKQRAVIARAIILGPELLVADEPVSMLDMSVRSKILQLMIDLKRDLNLTYLYITHDLATAKFFCDRIAIMYLGRIVEIGPAEEIYRDPKHPYTRSLLRAIPEPDPDLAVPRDLPRGEVPDAVRPPHGCSFHPRCPIAFDGCGWEPRDLRALLEERWTRLGADVDEAERPRFADLRVLDADGDVVRIPAGRGSTGADLVALFDAARASGAGVVGIDAEPGGAGSDADPLWAGVAGIDAEPDAAGSDADPLWAGVAGIDAEPDAAVVTFHPGTDPVLAEVDGVRVACLRYPGSYGDPAGGGARR